jgi:NAD(P)H-hydrate epimerase
MKYVTRSLVKRWLPLDRPPEAHKGDFGRLLVIGGSSKYTGAPALVGLAALKAGVDLVTICAPRETAMVVSTFSPDLITVKLPCTDLELEVLVEVLNEAKSADAVVMGPGLGRSEKTYSAVLELLKNFDQMGLPVLLDADGLKAAASQKSLLRNPKLVLTPHAGEFEILTGKPLPKELKERAEAVSSASKELGCTILLKSHVDIIAGGGQVLLNRTGNPGMTVGGTGDVLAGIVGAFLAQGVEPVRAAACGAYINGAAGDLCLKEKGYWFTATDVIEKIPEVLTKIWRGSR